MGTSTSLSYTLDNTLNPTYLTGTKYRFKITANNDIGESDYSNEVRIAIASLPGDPAAPTINSAKSTLTSLYVSWTAPTTGLDISVDGYKLYMGEKGSGVFSVIYDGSLNSDTLSYNVTGLTTGKTYSFYVVANNFNGEGDASDETYGLVCVAPSTIEDPYYVSSTTTSITIGWSAPSSTGGCPITTYELYVDDGLGGTLALTDNSVIYGKPYLSSHEVTGLT